MSEATIFQWAEEGGEQDFQREAPDEAEVFVRSISAPAGTPWDQTRAAQLEARLGAPGPIGELLYQVRRIGTWRLGQPSRFVAFYVRASAVNGHLAKVVDFDGRPLEVRFLSSGEQQRRANKVMVAFAIVAASLALSLAAIASALSHRAALDVALNGEQRLVASRLKQAEVFERLKAQTGALDALNVRHLKVSDVLSDLDWASSAKTPDSHIEAFHWEHGAIAVEVRGDIAPFPNDERIVRKSEHPLRPGIWLWGVAPANLFSAGSQAAGSARDVQP